MPKYKVLIKFSYLISFNLISRIKSEIQTFSANFKIPFSSGFLKLNSTAEILQKFI